MTECTIVIDREHKCFNTTESESVTNCSEDNAEGNFCVGAEHETEGMSSQSGHADIAGGYVSTLTRFLRPSIHSTLPTLPLYLVSLESLYCTAHLFFIFQGEDLGHLHRVVQ